ncbi:MAG: hypothetical protein ACMUIA_03800, partial [bacterium]
AFRSGHIRREINGAIPHLSAQIKMGHFPPLFIYVQLSNFPMANERILKLAGPLQATTENLFPAEYLNRFILSLF